MYCLHVYFIEEKKKKLGFFLHNLNSYNFSRSSWYTIKSYSINDIS